VYQVDTYFRIRELRQEQRLSQAKLAASLGQKSSSTIGMWETGTRRPPSKILSKLARVLHCSIDDLYATTAAQENAAP